MNTKRGNKEKLTGTINILPHKRHRPDITIPPQPLSRNTSTSSYVDRNEEYLSNGMNQFTIQFLRRMAESNKSMSITKDIGNECSLPNMFSTVLYICKLLHMNELEIALWSLCLESANKKDLELAVVLLVTAYQAKVNHK